jgi:hypothetical protein
MTLVDFYVNFGCKVTTRTQLDEFPQPTVSWRRNRMVEDSRKIGRQVDFGKILH